MRAGLRREDRSCRSEHESAGQKNVGGVVEGERRRPFVRAFGVCVCVGAQEVAGKHSFLSDHL